MYIPKVILTTLAVCSAVPAAKFRITDGVSRNTARNKIKAKLMENAKPLKRKLEDAEDEEVVIDLTEYSIVFEKCQYVKFYNAGDEDGGDEEGDDGFAINKFVVFKLCDSDSCSTACNYNYGEFVVDMETYVEAMIQMKQESVENMCEQCNENCQVDDQYGGDLSDDCQECLDKCDGYDNLEDNGMGDASEFIECAGGQNDDDAEYFTGAYCSDGGSAIKIGVFSDENCVNSVNGMDAATVQGFQNGFSYHILSAAYSSDCISCLQEVDEDEDQADDYEPETNEICQELYDAAGKCETNFKGGYLQYYDSQSSNEESVCEFISSLDSGTYDQTGEIVIGDGGVSYKKGGTTATNGQKFVLTIFILSTIGLASYAAILHQKITGGTTSGLSKQGGAMA